MERSLWRPWQPQIPAGKSRSKPSENGTGLRRYLLSSQNGSRHAARRNNGALAQAVTSGKALYVGLSNYDGPTLKKASAILDDMHVPFIINQNRYNIFDRAVEKNGLKETAAALGKGIICFSPLSQGMLSDRYLNGIPADSRVRTDGRFLKESNITDEKLKQIKKLNEIAKKRGQTLAEMALAWILRDGIITTVLIGASKSSQILDNIKALKNISFSDEELREIDEASAAI